nr:hypothetical protein [Tanacetum cinerariifolium]
MCLVRNYADMDMVNPILKEILLWFQPLATRRMFKAVVGKLIFVASFYYIWRERNNRVRHSKEVTKVYLESKVVMEVVGWLLGGDKVVTSRCKEASMVVCHGEGWLLGLKQPSICSKAFMTELDRHKNMVRGFPWILIGDFNMVLNLEDSFSGSSSLNYAISEFKECVNKIEVMDINSFRLHYTWNQKLKGGRGIMKKLDHIMGNLEFIDSFPGAYGIFQPYRISDRSSAWSMHVEGHYMYQVVTKMKALKKPLRKLLHSYGNLHDRVNALRRELDKVQKASDRNPNDTNLQDEEAVYVTAFNDAKLDDERFLKHKAKIEWLEVGDLNFAYFHNITDDEMKSAMFGIGDDRAPGHDRFTSVFFKKSLDVMGIDVCNAIWDFFTNGIEVRRGVRLRWISKKHDTVDWKFLGNILKCFGFHNTMVNWIMACGTSASFSLSINGDIHGYFQGKRGLRQDIITDVRSYNLLTFVLNVISSSLLKVKNNVKHAILSLMPFAEGDLPVKYLGIPLISSRLLNRNCKVLIKKSRTELGIGRINHYLLWGVFSYVSFLWCNGELKCGKAKVDWDVIYLLKREGGLRIRSLTVSNIALMTTHIWNIMSNKDSLWVKWIHIYILKGQTIWDISVKANMSWGMAQASSNLGAC